MSAINTAKRIIKALKDKVDKSKGISDDLKHELHSNERLKGENKPNDWEDTNKSSRDDNKRIHRNRGTSKSTNSHIHRGNR